MGVLPYPDIFGHTIFCDDVRQEEGGKLFYIGVYPGPSMLVHSAFPVTLPTIAFAISVSQRREIFVPRVGLRIFLPGDSETEASIQGDVGAETSAEAVLSHLDGVKGALHADARPHEDDAYPTMKAVLRFSQFVIKQPGRLRVRAVVGDDIVRLGGLGVSPAPQPGNEP